MYDFQGQFGVIFLVKKHAFILTAGHIWPIVIFILTELGAWAKQKFRVTVVVVYCITAKIHFWYSL